MGVTKEISYPRLKTSIFIIFYGSEIALPISLTNLDDMMLSDVENKVLYSKIPKLSEAYQKDRVFVGSGIWKVIKYSFLNFLYFNCRFLLLSFIKKINLLLSKFFLRNSNSLPQKSYFCSYILKYQFQISLLIIFSEKNC